MFLVLDKTLNIFGLQIAFYAICILIGVLLAVILGLREAKKLGVSSDKVYLGVLIIVPLAIIGARIWYILFNIEKFHSFSEIIGFNSNGDFVGLEGLAIQGGIIMAAISIIVYCKVRKISLYVAFDIVAPCLLVGQICGRWGNFFNQELYGPIIASEWYTNLIKGVFGDQMLINGAYRHPVFFYESILNLIGLIIILILRKKWKKLNLGDSIALYFLWYGSVRILTESLRMYGQAGDPLMLGPIPVSILISIIFVVLGSSLIILKRLLGGKEIKGKVFLPKEVPFLDYVDQILKNKFDTLIFDLDGTLLDSQDFIIESFRHTFEKFRPELDIKDEEYDSFFGPTLYQTFSKYGESEEEIDEMIKYYREYNLKGYDDNVRLFPGVKDTLATLSKKGYKIAIVSSKASDLVKHTMELFNIDKYINLYLGNGDYDNPKPAPDGILKAVEELDAKKAAYIGDTLSDIEAAKAAKVKSIGVLYIKNPEIYLENEPDYVINKINELISLCGE